MAYLTRTLPKRVFTPSLPQSIRQTRAITITTLQPTPTRPTQTTRTSKPRQLPQRTYHSALHARLPDHSYTNSQTAILTSALAHVPAHGFTATALTLGARDAGFLDVSVQLLPRAEFDLILFWLASRRGLLRGQVEEGGLFRRIAAEKGKDVHELSVEERVRGLILERLRMNAEVKGVWQDALAQMSLLANIPLSLTELHALASDILTLSGDDAVDATWYTRRLAVSAIYASAEVVMTRDPTPDLVETEAFVERRFEDRKVIADKLIGIGQCAGFGWNTAIGLGRSWGLKI
ncbi:Ubiquinone biosynthesis protein coq9, mitochondrial [Penicillium rubens]|uniref:uncharacterized protein n=1 Tax=Penicillium rubens TaxID=1108849 RepID=UPI001DDB061C|nr:uncharacterized protein N7525_005816 [Penicillium rubens]KAF3029978.1 Ubiquinone biosynthesis protein coq9, mitochondrial [Penicillium rubens]KAJ5043546.1 Ubiquinone biosynthesis protein coq9, mitochondrial [Penicillium rubens]KAJ5840628.1 hypothetical protein N7525_005816 [Penicillium rubens]KAJ5868607.1 hypothetical protein N7534_003160 [Penicillium rubens]